MAQGRARIHKSTTLDKCDNCNNPIRVRQTYVAVPKYRITQDGKKTGSNIRNCFSCFFKPKHEVANAAHP